MGSGSHRGNIFQVAVMLTGEDTPNVNTKASAISQEEVCETQLAATVSKSDS